MHAILLLEYILVAASNAQIYKSKIENTCKLAI